MSMYWLHGSLICDDCKVIWEKNYKPFLPSDLAKLSFDEPTIEAKKIFKLFMGNKLPKINTFIFR